VRQELQQLRLRIAEENQRLKQAEEKNYDFINQLRQDLAAKYPYTPLKFGEIQKLAAEKTAIVEWYILRQSFCAFIIANEPPQPPLIRVEQEGSENTLGETIWLYGQTEIPDTECQGVADELVRNLLKNTNFTLGLVDKGNLLKVPLFEYEISQPNQPKKLYRILFWIDNQRISPDVNSVHNSLFNSLLTRHKIEYVYQQAQESYSEARKAYSELEAKIKDFKQDKPLEELQKLLESMPELSMQYQRQLRNLQGHYTTIKTNQLNYQTYLKKFWQPGDIPSWREFGENTCKRYLDLETYLSYIQPGKDLIGEFINTLRGLVEIEQAKSDRQLQQSLQKNEEKEKEKERNLQNTIQAVGTGIGVGVGFAGIVAAGYPLIEKPWDFPSPQHPLLPPHPFIIAVVLSCLGGGGLGWLAWFFTKRHLKAKSSPQQTSLPSPQNQLPSGDV